MGNYQAWGKDADGSSDRMRKLVESQTNAIKGMGDTNARVMSEVKSQQSSTADTLKKDWEKASKAVDETHRRVAELNLKLQESQSQSSALGRDQDALTASFFRQIDGTKQLSNGMQSLWAHSGTDPCRAEKWQHYPARLSHSYIAFFRTY
ncbi:Uncharacterised protein [Hafnia alvei]|uniref:Phage-related minor tail protein n=1 Tax=Hafnia alvei TaxID=569 RepID=A0A377PFZ8_HAFAL|nr:Uncharacterised protein [Hafnia alvei]